MRRLRTLAVLTISAMLALLVGTPAVLAGQTRTYEVTITNLTTGQPFTPALAATHKGDDRFFTVGKAASFGLKEMAENGNLGPLVTRAQDDSSFNDVIIQPGNTADPIMPGETVQFTIEGGPPFIFLSWASMLICTNDGFTGVDRLKLPNRVGESVSVDTNAYDAGTEVNNELFAHLVPPCGPLTDQDSMGQGIGMSEPALAENGVIHHHGGILGVGDLDPAINNWADPVARITIERTG